MRGATALLSSVLLFGATPAHAGDAPPGAPPVAKKKVPPKPSARAWTISQKGDRTFVYDFNFKPGIPDAGQVTEIFVNVSETTKTPHPRYGRQVPQQNAKIVIELTSPAGQVVGRYAAHAIPLSRGVYGVHMTPKQDGIYTLTVVGTTEDGAKLSTEVKLPVNVWPLPTELQGSGESKKSGRRRPISR